MSQCELHNSLSHPLFWLGCWGACHQHSLWTALSGESSAGGHTGQHTLPTTNNQQEKDQQGEA